MRSKGSPDHGVKLCRANTSTFVIDRNDLSVDKFCLSSAVAVAVYGKELTPAMV